MSYESTGGSLKLKGISDSKIKKKKSSAKSILTVNKPNIASLSEMINSGQEKCIGKFKPTKTKAELKYEKVMEKRLEEKILKRAEKSHKEHVEDLNRHLDALTEYNDIPKVSWTK